MCEHASVIRASDPLGARTQTPVLGRTVHTVNSSPLQLQLSHTQQWGWQVTWVYWLCLWTAPREKGLSFSKSGVYMVGRLHWSRHMHAAWSTDPACWKSTIAFYSMFCPLHPSGMTDFGEVCHSPRVPASWSLLSACSGDKILTVFFFLSNLSLGFFLFQLLNF